MLFPYIQVMWENIMSGKDGAGCLLAFEMGLGKSWGSYDNFNNFG